MCKRAALKVELAIVVDFVILTAAVNLAHDSNLTAVAKEVSGNNPTLHQQWEVYGKTCVQSAIHYYYQQLRGSMKVPLQAFKAAHLFVPAEVQEVETEEPLWMS